MLFLGKMLQICALVLLPLSMLFEATGMLGRSFGLSEMLVMLVFGISAFLMGRLIEGYAPQKKNSN
jgi:TctA family transporter